MPVREADAERAVSDDFGQRERSTAAAATTTGLLSGEAESGWVNIEVALDELEVGCYRTEELVGFAIGDVAEAENLANFPRRKKLLELFMPRLWS